MKYSLQYFNFAMYITPLLYFGLRQNSYLHSFTLHSKYISPENFRLITNKEYSIAFPTIYCLKEPINNGFWRINFQCPCESNCLQCQDSSSHCISCHTSTLILKNNKCMCDQGYYYDLQKQLCRECSVLCKECTSSNNCTHCLDEENIMQVGSQCQCKDGSFFNTITRKCETCYSLCEVCILSYTNCSKCKNDTLISLEDNKCICQPPYFYNSKSKLCTRCMDAYYFNGVECSHCPLYCEECTSNFNCSKCVGVNIVLVNGQCQCVTGYYLNGESNNCEKCYALCTECSGNELNCSSCKCLDSIWHNKLSNSCMCLLGYSYSSEVESCVAPVLSAYNDVYALIGMVIVVVVLIGIGIVFMMRIRAYNSVRKESTQCDSHIDDTHK